MYPSFYEGWGLPVTESLDFGKLCLSSRGSSLAEAGEGLTVLLDPYDRTAWRNEIMRYWTDPSLLAERESTIALTHRQATAEGVVTKLLNLLTDVAEVSG